MKELTKIYFGERKLVDAGLIAISIIILQAWIAGGTNDPASFISLIALAASMPLLVYDLLILNLPIKYHGRLRFYLHYGLGRTLAAGGVVAAIWHVSWIGGIVFLISGVYATLLYYTIYKKNAEELGKMEMKKAATEASHENIEQKP